MRRGWLLRGAVIVLIGSGCVAGCTSDSGERPESNGAPSSASEPKPDSSASFAPIPIPDTTTLDRNANRIDDLFERQRIEIDEGVKKAPASERQSWIDRLDEEVPVEIVLSHPVEKKHLEAFSKVSGRVSYVFKA